MTLLLDQGLPRSAAVLLREKGIGAIHVGEIGMATAEDEAILERGRQEHLVIVTLDADFHALLALSGADSPSVIRIRIEGLRGEDLAQLLSRVIQECGESIARGAMITVQETRIRIRHLPLMLS